MNTEKELVIPVSKTKIFLITFGAAAFVALGILLFVIADEQPRYDPLVVKLVGVAAILFFGLAFGFSVKKLFDPSPGLIISADGIVDNSSGVAAGKIPWNEITGLTVTTVHSQRFLTVHVHHPERYLDQGGFLRRMANKANFKYYGSPIQISANSLKINFDDLITTIRQHLKKHGGA